MLMEKKFLTQMMIHEQGEVCLKSSLNQVIKDGLNILFLKNYNFFYHDNYVMMMMMMPMMIEMMMIIIMIMTIEMEIKMKQKKRMEVKRMEEEMKRKKEQGNTDR